TMVNSVLLQPLPYERAGQLVDLTHTLVVSGVAHVDQSDATYLVYRRDNHVFSDIGAYRSTAVNLDVSTAARSTGAAAERVTATLASASLFNVLRVAPILGRPLSQADDQPGAAPVVVISARLWQRDFASDPTITSRSIVVDGVTRQIVGVMPETFEFPNSASALWVPLQFDIGKLKTAAFDYRAVARLRDGTSIAGAVAELQRILPTVPEVYPGRLTADGIKAIHMEPVVRPLRDAVIGDVGRALWIVLGAVGLLLVIACANVANLFLARAEGRQRELAVRSALGAGQRALLLELLSEALVLAVAGGVLGVICAELGVAFLKSLDAATSIPRLSEVHIDALVLTVAGALTALAALVVSVLPLMRLNSPALSSMLLGNGRASTSSRMRNRARRALVVVQVALALMLICGAGVFARSFAHLRAVDPGFKPDQGLAFRVALPDAAYPTTVSAASTVLRAADAVRNAPGVQAVGVITKLPLDEESRQDSAVFIEDRPIEKGQIPGLHEINFATPEYFAAMGIPVLAGRLFPRADPNGQPAAGPPEAIVSSAFAARYWHGASALGKRIRMNPTDPWSTIVGIVGNVRGVGLDQAPTEEVYLPLVTNTVAGVPWIPRNVAFVVRSAGNMSTIPATVRRAVSESDPALPLYRLMPLRGLVTAATARTTFTLLLLSIAAIVATTIGALGIYGVISYLVSLRTREIGVRIALGADASDVRTLITRQAMTDAVIGVVLGLVGAVSLTRVLGAVTFDASAADPVTLGAAALLLIITAYLASWLPARRAAALDPTMALRSE
ncbi:MAG TPA: ABC transporter permease, partial [Gemmatimonadaceae bacterium]